MIEAAGRWLASRVCGLPLRLPCPALPVCLPGLASTPPRLTLGVAPLASRSGFGPGGDRISEGDLRGSN